MRVIDSRVEDAGSGLWRLIVTFDRESEQATPSSPPLGEGPTGDAVPDRIVRALIENLPSGSMTLVELCDTVGGNRGTINRQAWTLASNAPDLQRRLRGWVVSPERGRYALSAAARERLMYKASRNEGWMKALSWDSPVEFDDFIVHIAGGAESTEQAQVILRDFMRLPAWEAAPDSIRTGAKGFLK